MILNRDPDDKEPKRLVFENYTFSPPFKAGWGFAVAMDPFTAPLEYADGEPQHFEWPRPT